MDRYGPVPPAMEQGLIDDNIIDVSWDSASAIANANIITNLDKIDAAFDAIRRTRDLDEVHAERCEMMDRYQPFADALSDHLATMDRDE